MSTKQVFFITDTGTSETVQVSSLFQKISLHVEYEILTFLNIVFI
jgi:hypothetical protein